MTVDEPSAAAMAPVAIKKEVVLRRAPPSLWLPGRSAIPIVLPPAAYVASIYGIRLDFCTFYRNPHRLLFTVTAYPQPIPRPQTVSFSGFPVLTSGIIR
ncbi:hypothetical protein K438DRAFT_1956988 [Mycena galopus ATCC 62051]|nr:hypothetical protein K438DRAFT_1956988 [Mycena galopus ATCC 62051]